MRFGSSTTASGAVLLLLVTTIATAAEDRDPANAASLSGASRATPVVVELFSSEGCSSCPPAETFLRDFASRSRGAGVPLVLEYHVDYWNYLGWTDPFSRPEFTERQTAYAKAFGDGRLYTPEIVVQGRSALPSRSAATLEERIRREAAEPRADVVVSLRDGMAHVHVSHAKATPEDAVDVLLAVAESGLRSEVRAGENRGETLVHAPVVRRLVTLGAVTSGAFDGGARLDVDPAWQPRNVRLVALVQGRRSRRILGAASVPLNPPTGEVEK